MGHRGHGFDWSIRLLDPRIGEEAGPELPGKPHCPLVNCRKADERRRNGRTISG